VRECIRICRQRNVTIWHAHDYKSNFLGLLVRRFHPMHLVTTAHGWVRFTSRTPLYYRIDRFCMKRYERVICVSPDLIEECQNAGIRSDLLKLIDNAICTDDYSTAAVTASDRAKFASGNVRLLIGAAGRLSEEKGFDHLIAAVGRLISHGYDVGLAIAGEGHLRDTLQKQIDSLGFAERIRLVGFLSDPRELYQASDLFVLSSLREGLPNVVLEAMASARPVIATRCNGIPRLITDNENGLVVEPGSSDQLFQAMQLCCDSEALRQRLAAEGHRTVSEHFDFRQRMQKVVAVYRSLSPELEVALPEAVRPHCISSPVNSCDSRSSEPAEALV
ncbi:MAG: glycosyltransferase, partial [Planctomycetaceae bacterium]|nr:glycosyltransferase [Planctomycetaceae bacterium]